MSQRELREAYVELLIELEETEPPEELWHGTGEKYVNSIDAQGLIPKSRLYVHLSKDADTAVKVGQRHGKPVLYIVKAGEMHREGYKFFLSKNGVWLTKEVPVKLTLTVFPSFNCCYHFRVIFRCVIGVINETYFSNFFKYTYCSTIKYCLCRIDIFSNIHFEV